MSLDNDLTQGFASATIVHLNGEEIGCVGLKCQSECIPNELVVLVDVCSEETGNVIGWSIADCEFFWIRNTFLKTVMGVEACVESLDVCSECFAPFAKFAWSFTRVFCCCQMEVLLSGGTKRRKKKERGCEREKKKSQRKSQFARAICSPERDEASRKTKSLN